VIADSVIAAVIEGKRMPIEFQNPTFIPLHSMPVQAASHAFHHASNVTGIGSENISPNRIWSIVLNEVTMIT
jgi:hypothetical protein